MKITNLLNTALKLSIAVTLLLAITTLIGTNVLSTRGQQLRDTITQTQELQKQNTNLSNQISRSSSLTHIETWAKHHNFLPISQPLTLTTPAPVAFVR